MIEKISLKGIRNARGYTQEQAAKMLGISPATLSSYERGKSFPDIPTLKKIEKAYDIAYSDIIFLT